METISASCVSCGRNIDSAAKLCPYCGADRATGQKMDTQAVLQEIFRPRTMTTSESVIEFARQRQGVVIGVSALVLLVALTLIHQFVTARNASAVSAAPPIPLTEIADLSGRPDETTAVAMPQLDFGYDGQPKAMRTFIVEPGAATPPEVIAAQQAAQAEAAAKQTASTVRPPAATPPQPQTPAAQQPAVQAPPQPAPQRAQ